MAQTWIDLLETKDINYVTLQRLKAVLERNPSLWSPFMTVDDVMVRARSGDYQIWIGGKVGDDQPEMWALTEYLTYPRCRALVIVWCGGKNAPDYFERFTKCVEELAIMLDCSVVEIRGRAGWARALRDLGYKPSETILSKEVANGQGRVGERNADEQGGADPGAEGAAAPGDGAVSGESRRGDPTAT